MPTSTRAGIPSPNQQSGASGLKGTINYKWLVLAGCLCVFQLPEIGSAKSSRVRTNFKLRVGDVGIKPIGRYTPYSQVRIPPTANFKSGEGERYYRHAKGARITKASHFDHEYQLGHKITFICVARGKPRPKITWFKDGAELYYHNFLHITEYQFGKGRIKSKMEIDPATQGDAGIYECHANNKWSVDMRSFRTDYSILLD